MKRLESLKLNLVSNSRDGNQIGKYTRHAWDYLYKFETTYLHKAGIFLALGAMICTGVIFTIDINPPLKDLAPSTIFCGAAIIAFLLNYLLMQDINFTPYFEDAISESISKMGGVLGVLATMGFLVAQSIIGIKKTIHIFQLGFFSAGFVERFYYNKQYPTVINITNLIALVASEVTIYFSNLQMCPFDLNGLGVACAREHEVHGNAVIGYAAAVFSACAVSWMLICFNKLSTELFLTSYSYAIMYLAIASPFSMLIFPFEIPSLSQVVLIVIIGILIQLAVLMFFRALQYQYLVLVITAFSSWVMITFISGYFVGREFHLLGWISCGVVAVCVYYSVVNADCLKSEKQSLDPLYEEFNKVKRKSEDRIDEDLEPPKNYKRGYSDLSLMKFTEIMELPEYSLKSPSNLAREPSRISSSKNLTIVPSEMHPQLHSRFKDFQSFQKKVPLLVQGLRSKGVQHMDILLGYNTPVSVKPVFSASNLHDFPLHDQIILILRTVLDEFKTRQNSPQTDHESGSNLTHYEIFALEPGKLVSLEPLVERAIKDYEETRIFQYIIIVSYTDITPLEENLTAIEKSSQYPIGIGFIGIEEESQAVGRGAQLDQWKWVKELANRTNQKVFNNLSFLVYSTEMSPELFVSMALQDLHSQYKYCVNQKWIDS